MYRLTDYGSMLRDRRRIDAYRRALASLITPTSTVLDLGTGLGTFAILAARLGAARVYAVDAADVITVAAENASASGVADRITFLQTSAAGLALPEPVDLIVSDLSGALPLFEEHLPSLMRVRDAFLRRGGALIPMRDRLLCAPISSTALYETITAPWRSVPEIDFAPSLTMALHAPHAMNVRPEQLAAEPRCWAELDYATIASANVSASVEWEVDAEVHGIALWFESTLQDGVTSASGPWSEGSIHATMVLPLFAPLRVHGALRLTIEATLANGRYVITWQANHGARQSTFLSEPRSGASLTDRSASTPAAASGETFRVAEHALCRKVGHDALLFDTVAGTYHVLNETGARVWELLVRGEGLDAIAAAVAADYEVDAQRAAEDVAAIVAQLREANLVV
ncbi:MAG TPA: PqqD family peptide modification chaperone [Thermoanaerobaculia bacterium]|jgi:SAM-dependent methyltransferase|nr:PqqD family peptide modification chaperone [Thermoanaerobaculia bacterium]